MIDDFTRETTLMPRKTSRGRMPYSLTAIGLLFAAMAGVASAGTAAPHARTKRLLSNPNPMLDQQRAMPAAQRNLTTGANSHLPSAVVDSTAANPNFAGFRVAPYTPAHAAGDTDKIISAVEGDFNKDGKMDMVSFQADTLTLMLGDGKGGFTNGGSQTTANNVYAPIAVDLNNDGYPDIVAMTLPFGYMGTVVVIMNQRNGTFAAPVTVSRPASIYSGLTNFNLADIDGDGKLDLIVAGIGTTDDNPNSNVVFEVVFGNGDGTFRTSQLVETDGVLPNKPSFGYGGGTVMRQIKGRWTMLATVLNVANIDGTNFVSTQIDEYPIASSGVVTTSNVASIDVSGLYTTSPNRYLQFQDLNGDGVDDLTFIQGDGELYVLLGNPDGTFQKPISALPVDFPLDTAVVSFRDVDGDGILDAVMAGSGLIAVYPGNGDGTFRAPKESYLAGYGIDGIEGITFAVKDNAIDDFDGDGIADVVYFDTSKRSLAFYKGKSDGTFIGAPAMALTAGAYATNELFAYAAPDLNGDGFPDLIVDSPYGVLSGINDGKGNMTYKLAAPSLTSLAEIVSYTADFNKDGKDDVLFLTTDTSYLYHLFIGYSNGDGTLTTVEQALPFSAENAPLLAVGDINGDGYPDLALTNVNYITNQYGVWTMLNDGKGNLKAGTYIPISTTSTSLYALALADANNDGRADLFLSYGGYDSTTLSEWLGPKDGNLSSVSPIVVQTTLPIGGILVKDATGDKIPDILASVTNGDSEGLVLYPGKGDGTFGEPSSLASGIVVDAMEVNDYNGDGIPDVVFSNDETSLPDTADNQLGVVVLRGNGDGTFAAPRAFGVYGASPSLLTVDLVHNGSPEILAQAAIGTTVLLNQGTSLLSLTASATAVTTTEAADVTVAVAPYYHDRPTPSGTVKLLLDGATYASGTLDATGKANFQVAKLTSGSHSVSAIYAGDENYNINKNSGTTTITVTHAQAAFQLTSNPGALSLAQGANGSATLSLTANAAFAGPVALSCSGLPANSACGFDPASVTLSPSQTATATLSLSTAATATAANHSGAPFGPSGMALAGLLLLVPLFRKRRALTWMVLALSVAGIASLTACGSGNSDTRTKAAPGIYAVTVTATPADATVAPHSVVLTLTVSK